MHTQRFVPDCNATKFCDFNYTKEFNVWSKFGANVFVGVRDTDNYAN